MDLEEAVPLLPHLLHGWEQRKAWQELGWNTGLRDGFGLLDIVESVLKATERAPLAVAFPGKIALIK